MVLPVAAAASKLATMAAKQIAGRVAAKVPGAQAHKQMQRGVVVAGIAGLLLVALLAVTLLAGLLSSLTGTVGGLTADDGVCGGGGGASPEAIADIPPNYLSLYQSAAAKIPGLDWTFVAAIGKIETNHGRSPLPGVLSGTNSSGAAGPMQFLLSTWRSVGVDGDGNGTKNVYDPADAIPGAAGYLQIEGAPGNMHDAIFAYNHAEWYVQDVITQAAVYRGTALPIASVPVPFGASPTPAPPMPLIPITCGGIGGIGGGGTGGGAGPWGGYSNGLIPASALCYIRVNQMLRCDAAAAFLQMDASYKRSFGVQICITDSYRSLADQIDVKRRKPGLAATPGKSNHGWGLAVDLCGGIQTFGSAAHQWMRANAPAFKWIHPAWAQQGGSKPEAWHWEFSG